MITTIDRSDERHAFAVWQAFRARGWLAPSLSADSFRVLHRYAAKLAAVGTITDAYDLLCPALVRASPDVARRVAAEAGELGLPSPTAAEGGDASGDPFAAVLGGFAHWACERLAGMPVFGLMRDGGVLADAFVQADPRAAVGKLWLSRRLCLLAALAGPDDHEGLVNLLVRARGHPPSAAEAARDLGLVDNPPEIILDQEHLSTFLDWLVERRSALDDSIRTCRRGILRHMHARGVFDKSAVALLDVGYAATLQRTLVRICALEGRELTLHGAYLLTSPGAVWAVRESGTVYGFLADFGAPEAFTATFLRCREVLEVLCASGDGALSGYDQNGDPVLAPPVLGEDQRTEVRAIQNTALAALPTSSATQARRSWLRMLTAPTPEEAARIGCLLYDDPLAVGSPRRLTETKLLPADAILSASRAEVLWPAGAVAAGSANSHVKRVNWPWAGAGQQNEGLR